MAIEKFENRILTGNINVACKFDDGTVRHWITRKEEVVEHIVQIVEEYAEEGYILTLRQLHYQLVGKNWIINHLTAYKKLGSILDDCRYAGIIDWDAIEDRGRVPYIPYSVKDIQDALQDTLDQYRLDRQDGQDNIVELWTEKDALSGILKRTTEKYHIRLVVNKGYTSSSAIYEAYQRVETNYRHNKKSIILYFGDHDPSGLDMIRDIRERLSMMLINGDSMLDESDVQEYLKIVPIGLTMEQIKKYKLPPNPTKFTDKRSKKYIEKFGKICWEVDALKPQVLTSIVEKSIKEYIDIEMYEEMVSKESDDIEKLRSFIEDNQ